MEKLLRAWNVKADPFCLNGQKGPNKPLFDFQYALKCWHGLVSYISGEPVRTSSSVLFIENFIQHTFSSKKAIYRNSCHTLLLHWGSESGKDQIKVWFCRSLLYCTFFFFGNKTKPKMQLVLKRKRKQKKKIPQTELEKTVIGTSGTQSKSYTQEIWTPGSFCTQQQRHELLLNFTPP